MFNDNHHCTPVTVFTKAFAQEDNNLTLLQCFWGLQRCFKAYGCMAIATLILSGCDVNLNKESDEYSGSEDTQLNIMPDVSAIDTNGASHIDAGIESTKKEVAQYLSPPLSTQNLQAISWQTKVQSPHCFSYTDPPSSLAAETVAPVAVDKSKHGAVPACIAFELNTLDFSPAQPWLSDIMWQTIAHQAVPDKTISTEHGAAKMAVKMMLRQIRGLQNSAINLPIYQYINTQFAINKNQTGYLKIDSVRQRFEHSPRQYYTYYKMVDIKQQKQLALGDILSKGYSHTELLTLLQQMPKVLQSDLEPIYDLPVDLPAQWYLDDLGLHLVYQPGEMIQQTLDIHSDRVLDNSNLNEIIELVVAYDMINSMLKSEYQVGEEVVDIAVSDNTDAVSQSWSDQQDKTTVTEVKNNAHAINPSDINDISNDKRHESDKAVHDDDEHSVEISKSMTPIIVRQLGYN